MGEALYESFKEECIDGKIYLLSTSANPKHGRIISNIVTLFGSYFKTNNGDCDVFGDNIDVYLNGDVNDMYVVPDISIICDLDKMSKKGYMGVPSLICEVISPSTKNRDEIIKYKLYEKFKVPEYWQINYFDMSVKQSILGDDDKYNDTVYSLLDESEFNRLSSENKDNYSDKFRCNQFNIEIDLKEVFYHIDKYK